MSDLEMYGLLMGFALPPVLAVVMRTAWSAQLRSAVAFIACLIASAGLVYFQGDLTGRRLVSAALVVLVAALATYQSFWKPIGVAPAIEARTNPPPG